MERRQSLLYGSFSFCTPNRPILPCLLAYFEGSKPSEGGISNESSAKGSNSAPACRRSKLLENSRSIRPLSEYRPILLPQKQPRRHRLGGTRTCGRYLLPPLWNTGQANHWKEAKAILLGSVPNGLVECSSGSGNQKKRSTLHLRDLWSNF